jgi:hypothetical protein
VILKKDKRRGRLNTIRHILSSIDYTGKDKGAIGEIDGKIVDSASAFLKKL